MEIKKKENNNYFFKIKDEDGAVNMDCYEVFDGIYLVYNDVDLLKCEDQNLIMEDVFGLEHCSEGKVEWKLENEDYAYLGAGSITPCDYSKSSRDFQFPLRHYQGMSLTFHLKKAQDSIPKEVPIDLSYIKESLMKAGTINLNNDVRASYVLGMVYEARTQSLLHKKMAVLEFLLLLSEIEWDAMTQKPLYFPKPQVEKIKEIEIFLCENLEKKYTLLDLSRQFSIPVTAIRKCFPGVFGDSPSSYIRKKRMEKAKYFLANSKKPIVEIALLVGYDNPSKFSAAFRSYTNQSPYVYRSNIESRSEQGKQCGVDEFFLE